ncbi:MAG: hypothetical protein EXS15_03145 [Phycisphaerales bacterium]|nr:hypothetical protein [Phycisphaerales bacterium]
MFVSLCICLSLARNAVQQSECPGLDASSASLTDRRTALDACAAGHNKRPIDFFLERISNLAPHDPRSDEYGDLIAAWSVEELSQDSVKSQLMSIYESPSNSGSSRVVALRALLALAQPSRPSSIAVIGLCSIEITAVPSKMAYDIREFTVAPGTLVHLTLHNPDALEHNLLFVAPGALAEIGIAGDRMDRTPDGKAKEFVPDSPKVLEVMGLVAPGKSRSMWFIAPSKPGTYPFVCTYPSHWRTMNGKMKVVTPAPKQDPSPAQAAALPTPP